MDDALYHVGYELSDYEHESRLENSFESLNVDFQKGLSNKQQRRDLFLRNIRFS